MRPLAGDTAMTDDPIVIRTNIRICLAALKVETDYWRRSDIKRMLKEAQGELLRVTARVEPPASD